MTSEPTTPEAMVEAIRRMNPPRPGAVFTVLAKDLVLLPDVMHGRHVWLDTATRTTYLGARVGTAAPRGRPKGSKTKC